MAATQTFLFYLILVSATASGTINELVTPDRILGGEPARSTVGECECNVGDANPSAVVPQKPMPTDQFQMLFEGWLARGVFFSIVASLLVFFLTQLTIWRRERSQTRDSVIALRSEVSINLGSLEHIYDNTLLTVKTRSALETLIKVDTTQRKLGRATSTAIFDNIDVSHLRKTRVIGTVLQLYSNIASCSSSSVVLKDGESGIANLNQEAFREVQIFLFRLFVLSMQCTYTLQLLSSKKMFYGDGLEHALIRPLDFFDDQWDFSKSRLATFDGFSQRPLSLKTILYRMAVLLRLEQKLPVSCLIEEYYIVEEPAALREMLVAIRDKKVRDGYIGKFNELRSLPFS